MSCFPAIRVRELTTSKIGTLLKISGQVVRTHPVHPELVSGTFLCLECQTVIHNVTQQFKFTQVLFLSLLASFISSSLLPHYSISSFDL